MGHICVACWMMGVSPGGMSERSAEPARWRTARMCSDLAYAWPRRIPVATRARDRHVSDELRCFTRASMWGARYRVLLRVGSCHAGVIALIEGVLPVGQSGEYQHCQFCVGSGSSAYWHANYTMLPCPSHWRFHHGKHVPLDHVVHVALTPHATEPHARLAMLMQWQIVVAGAHAGCADASSRFNDDDKLTNAASSWGSGPASRPGPPRSLCNSLSVDLVFTHHNFNYELPYIILKVKVSYYNIPVSLEAMAAAHLRSRSDKALQATGGLEKIIKG